MCVCVGGGGGGGGLEVGIGRVESFSCKVQYNILIWKGQKSS